MAPGVTAATANDAEAICAVHAVEATGVCVRCGVFVCGQCNNNICEACHEKARAAGSDPVPSFFLKAWNSWALRSLAIGGVATLLDIALGTTLLSLGLPTRAAAMIGVVLGATFTFFANRHFAFREHNPKLASPAIRFIIVTGLSSVVHGQLVVWLRDRYGVPFVISKMAADIVVFTFGQLLLLRYVVFPKKKHDAAHAKAPADQRTA